MADPMSGPITHCQWCSAELPAPDAERCPSCGATLTSATGTEPQLPGVTALDPEAILRARSEVARPRNRILSFLTGEAPAAEANETADPASFAPPSDEVRREMLRLQIEAERADLEAETVALKADALSHLGVPLAELEGKPDAADEVDAAGEVDAAASSDADADAPPADDASPEAGDAGKSPQPVPEAPPAP